MAHIDLNNDWLFTPVWSEAFGRGDPPAGTAGAGSGTANAESEATDTTAANAHQGSAWRAVRLPHTCCETPFHYFDESVYQMICGYRRVISAPKDWRGKRIFLTVGAAGHSAEVFLNEHKIAEHHCGYTAFKVELTDYIRYGRDNVLAIRVNSREDQDIPPFGYVVDYMTYGGLYREVSLEIKEPVFLEDVFAKPFIREGRHGPVFVESLPEAPLNEEDGVSGRIDSEIVISGKFDVEGRRLMIRQRVLPYENEAAARNPFGDSESPGDGAWPAEDIPEAFAGIKSEPLAVQTFAVDDCKTGMRTWHNEGHIARLISLGVSEIRLWSIDSPVLYVLRTELISTRVEKPKTAKNVAEASLTGLLSREFDADEILLDIRDDVIGFRSAGFRKDGFYLNGKKVRFVGLNRHQSWPYAGYAMPASQQILDAEIAKYELGINALRTSHYPQSPHFMRRCDELGILVFTEIPGWQHIGGMSWKDQALRNVEDMILQNRNHPCVFLWGTRINESVDDDDFYGKTAKCARALDPTRPLSGVRCFKKSRLIEDVYAYNDFSHSGANAGCEKKKAVTSDMNRAYFISECNGHMYPAKAFDNEDIRLNHALRHANVMNAALGEPDIAGLFEWCLFDYNTHKDFGSGDRICYHGVLDMFRNPKMAAAVYASQQDETPFLEVSSLMIMGEHPGSAPGKSYIFTNADEVRFYRNNRLVATFEGKPAANREAGGRPDQENAQETKKGLFGRIRANRDQTDGGQPEPVARFSRNVGGEGGRWPQLKHPPILIDQYISDEMEEKEGFTPAQASDVKALLNYAAVYGFDRLPAHLKAKAAKMMMKYRMTFEDAYRLYGTYIGAWGEGTAGFRFEAVKDGKVVKRLIRSVTTDLQIEARVDHTDLVEGATYDVASVRIRMCDQNGTALPFYSGRVSAEISGPIAFYGAREAQLRGGMGGLYIRTTGESGEASLTLRNEQTEPVTIRFTVRPA